MDQIFWHLIDYTMYTMYAMHLWVYQHSYQANITLPVGPIESNSHKPKILRYELKATIKNSANDYDDDVILFVG